jgi:ABC-2 type transport system ATP-binding protein
MMAQIEVHDLTREFTVYKKRRGFWGSLLDLASSERTVVRAVDGISFSIDKGECVGYIGPNGAGKSTTIKMLIGILVTTSGEVTVDGYTPHKARVQYAQRIGVVFGQRTQLYWDLPVIESLELMKYIYDIPEATFKRNVDFLTELLGMGEFIRTPARQLSLGQRMRCDIAASFLHDPEIVYLDEPTIALDIVAKEKIREFIKNINREKKVTILLTTHDLSDIEKLCNRIMIIDHGKIIYDGCIEEIRRRFGTSRILVVDLEEDYPSLSIDGARLVKEEGRRKWLEFDKERISAPDLVKEVMQKHAVSDLRIEEPEIGAVVRRIYEGGMGSSDPARKA